MQQQLDFLEGLDDTPAKVKGKGKKKGRLLESGTSSDSDAYDGSTHHDAGDDTDDTDSMNVDPERPLTPGPPKKQPRNLAAPFATVQSRPTLPPSTDQECGLCGHIHGPGACSMMHDSSNLMEYREILLNHTTGEPWEYRVRIGSVSFER